MISKGVASMHTRQFFPVGCSLPPSSSTCACTARLPISATSRHSNCKAKCWLTCNCRQIVMRHDFALRDTPRYTAAGSKADALVSDAVDIFKQSPGDMCDQGTASCRVCGNTAWRRMSQHCNLRSAATTWRSCPSCQSQDTAQMD
jgi:hypothetical protein